jgi:hypothetical protein
MVIYKRNTRKKLIFLRLLLIALLSAILILFLTGLKDYGFVVMMLLLFMTIFRVSSITLYADRMELSFYYFFGLARYKTLFRKEDNIIVHPFQIEMNDPVTDDYGVGDLFTRPATIQKYTIASVDLTGAAQQVTIDLSWEELQLVKHSCTENQQR